jgi:hypothetical protein
VLFYSSIFLKNERKDDFQNEKEEEIDFLIEKKKKVQKQVA